MLPKDSSVYHSNAGHGGEGGLNLLWRCEVQLTVKMPVARIQNLRYIVNKTFI